MQLHCAYPSVLPFVMGVGDMPPEQLIRIIRAQDLALVFTMDRPRSIAGWAVSFTVAIKLAGAVQFTKTVGSGITLTDTGRGILTVSIAKANTSSLTVTTGLATGEGYVWELCRTDADNRIVLARGELILEREVTA